eukprot:11345686-Heterocapsa_arctica.AAC.1
MLPNTGGQDQEVEALIMDNMDLNICSMGQMVDVRRFTSVWSSDGGCLWRDPNTLEWVRLVVENHVP